MVSFFALNVLTLDTEVDARFRHRRLERLQTGH